MRKTRRTSQPLKTLPPWWQWTKYLAEALEPLRHWGTPPGVTRAVLEVHPPPFTAGWITEPSAGAGGITRVLLEETSHGVSMIELNPVHTGVLVDLCRAHLGRATVYIGDWLRFDRLPGPVGVEQGLIANVPWKPTSVMMAHVRQCVRLAPTYCALYLPTDALQAKSRAGWWQKNTPQGLYLLAERASHSENGRNGTQNGVWCVWDAAMRAAGKQRHGVLTWKRLDTGAAEVANEAA